LKSGLQTNLKIEIMKNSISIITTVLSVIISLNLTAQHRSRGNENPQYQQQNQSQQQSQGQSQYQSYDARWGHGHNNGWNNWGGGVTVHIGNTPNYGYNNYGYGNNYYSNYNNNYNNYYSVKNAARNSLRQAAQVIGNALQFSDWNDTYSPWLAKAIRHQQYAKQLYFWGDYAGALNHAERANFLAWNTLTYFNNGNGYNNGYGNNGNYQDPYQDPNNPYYRKGNSQSTNPNSTNPNNTGTNNTDEDFGYRKSQDTQTDNSKDQNTSTGNQPNTNTGIQKAEVDGQLPQSKLTDQDLLKTNAKELDVE
jgi:uncharacterized protein YxeA